MQVSDQKICSYFSEDRRKAMECLFTKYYRPLVLWSSTFLRDVFSAEDTVQEFMMKIWESGRSDLRPEPLRQFLYTSVRNASLDRLEKNDPLRRAAGITGINPPWEDFESYEKEILNSLKKEIAVLPQRTRQVIEAVYLDGLTYKAAAEKLGVSVNTVNTLLVAGMKKLREHVRRTGNPMLGIYCMLLPSFSRGPRF